MNLFQHLICFAAVWAGGPQSFKLVLAPSAEVFFLGHWFFFRSQSEFFIDDVTAAAAVA